MADIAVTATDVRAVKVFQQFTGPAAVAMDAGTPVYLDASGHFAKCDASAAGTSVCCGLAMNTITYVGETLTVLARGLIDLGDGFTDDAYGAPIYLSNTEGALADAAGDTSVIVGRVFPAWGAVTPADKLLRVSV